MFKLDKNSLKKLQHKKDNDNETYHGSNLLPCFGVDLDIYEDCDIIDKCGSNIGWRYEAPNGIIKNSIEAKSYMAG